MQEADRPSNNHRNTVETSSFEPTRPDQDKVPPASRTHRPATANAVCSSHSVTRPSQRRASLSEKRHFELNNNGHVKLEAPIAHQPEDLRQEAKSPPVIVDHQQPVSTLRKYYSDLDASTHTRTESSGLLRRTSYTLNSGTRLKAESVPNVDTFASELVVTTEDNMPINHYDERVQRHAASVEELRQIFERPETEEPERELRPSMRQFTSFHHYPPQPVHNNMSKSVEFFSRPPKYRTLSPRPTNLPTPPPLPLPPSSPEMAPRAEHPYNHNKVRSKNYVTRFSQCAQPIVSMHMPFRSRSLALDRHGWSSEMLQPRPRAGSITQRSVSPLPNPNSRGRSRRKHVTHSSRSKQKCQQFVGVQGCGFQNCDENPHGRRSPRRVINKATQSTNQVVPSSDVDTVKLPGSDIIHLSPADTDGVYVRSAVVYERVADRTEHSDQRHFVTTYVISQGQSPSRSTVQATNLWVAEQALLSAGGSQDGKQSALPPYRTQTMPRIEQETPTKLTGTHLPKRSQVTYSSYRAPGRPKSSRPRSRSLSTSRQAPVDETSAGYMQEPAPLPTPPPAEMHRYMLRCSSQDASFDRFDQKTPQSGADKAVQWEEPYNLCRRKHSPSPARSWSVRSLSPPPFRTPWLSSMGSVRSKRSTSKSPYPRETKPGAEQDEFEQLAVYDGENLMTHHHCSRSHAHPCCCCSCSRSRIEAYDMERLREREARDRREWVSRAETVRRERQAYHQARGSWSPPALRSPARNTPNNLEEQTEREIRGRVRQHKPLSPVPVVPLPMYPMTRPLYDDEPVAVDEAVQCDQSMMGIKGTNSQLNVDTSLPDGIDTTPITENFNGKRAYFEELIKTNKMMARCSFCSDCYHCPHGQLPRISCSSSWDSEIQQTTSPVYAKRNTVNTCADYTQTGQSYIRYQDYSELNNRQAGPTTKAFSSAVYDSHESNSREPVTHRVYKVESVREPIRNGPQQYASSICLTSYPAQKASYNTRPSRAGKPYTSAFEGNSIQHDYYARPQMAMPKVAPNPPGDPIASTRPYYKWTPLCIDRVIQPLRAELIHSPTATTTNFVQNRSAHLPRDCLPITDRPHSPDCRFYDGSRDVVPKADSWDSLNRARGESDSTYRGRVRQIVCELNERAMQETHLIDETYPAYSSPDLRRSVRYN
ncbi:hypothetical protein FBUS_03014 [Fasciolopsis buskii]|uniref:Uncharacterized protein n=1 Tax=Fasciolopsis buskii TaxID=27845 RepID=A0A8E0VNC6_9TREM|nr:hypothetical protein FBUS_03014 [Fasciolopsis buski]